MSFFLTMLVGFTMSAAADGDGARPCVGGITVQCLTEGKKVIPLYSNCGQFWKTDVKLPDLLIVNRGNEPVTPCEVQIVGVAEGREVATVRPAMDLANLTRQVTVQFREMLGDGVLERVGVPRKATGFGAMAFGGTRLSESETVRPGESAVVLLSHVLFFTYTGVAKVDDVRVAVVVQQGSRRVRVPCEVRLHAYETRGDYIFPLKGDLCVTNLPTNIVQHRPALSQEFALDIVSSGLIENGQGPGATGGDRSSLADYPIFHRDVIAIGAGTVAEVADKYPDTLMDDPSAYSEARFEELTAQLEPEIGFASCVLGNYVVIDHENGEFSLCAHLSGDTIRVAVGDRVAQGDVIAAVGNTGRSTQPHLHFQLMDSKDFLTANGLPVMFKNMPPTAIDQNCTKSNSLTATDYVMLRVE